MIDDPLAGQARDEECAGQQVGRGAARDLGFLVDDPGDLRGAMVGVKVQAGDRPDLVVADAVAQGGCLAGGAPVHPDDRGPQRPVVGVDRHDPIDLAREPERADLVGRDATLLLERRDDLDERALPGQRVLFGPHVVRMVDLVRGRCARDDRPLAVDEDALETLGPDVAADGVDRSVSRTDVTSHLMT